MQSALKVSLAAPKRTPHSETSHMAYRTRIFIAVLSVTPHAAARRSLR